MKELKGKYTTAKVFSDNVEQYALAQIQLLIDHPAFAGSKVRVMPDVHPGTIGPIGFTATVGNSILPGVVGIDIGCGMTMATLRQTKVEFSKLDAVSISAGRRTGSQTISISAVSSVFGISIVRKRKTAWARWAAATTLLNWTGPKPVNSAL